ncbi:VOC family protein [Micromonospora endolithica]|uniref:VOC family protein n=1 Tax=Micromonospora endolithica TaxID=230091 RepID=A0A3A9YZE2_9ACTN|nr:VOC family protein [Micromonospora endolithica]RKN41054.1 VOC family protein [Micromonospora endolithica]TWJ24275.1 methylmalonyl-CoA/ethylmalonyl-CoA epimerase [Micromonospora endolithica]
MTLHERAAGLDHIGLVVPDTEAALSLWRDRLGFVVDHAEVVNEGGILLTHLDLGPVHLQLVQPLVRPHPLHDWLDRHGPGLHHLCFGVPDVGVAWQGDGVGVPPAQPAPHQGTRGRRAVFLDPAHTGGVQLELVGS